MALHIQWQWGQREVTVWAGDHPEHLKLCQSLDSVSSQPVGGQNLGDRQAST
ncbi:MAG: hypothetical protein HC838_01760 [Spirulinaceae cyanobacterium RM2_2_10]|nr:hypothetical protein [Spirulinaceae cyanobacterium SM2_1_0]NJO19039.1 hypothetical protein [Spirulinaceae cyanobacterium RM2_2_10]